MPQIDDSRIGISEKHTLIQRTYESADRAIKHKIEFDTSFSIVALYQKGDDIRALCFGTGDTIVALDNGEFVITILSARNVLEKDSTPPLSFPSPKHGHATLQRTVDHLEIIDIGVLPGQRLLFLTDGVYQHLPHQSVELCDSDGLVIKRTSLNERALRAGQPINEIVKLAGQIITETFKKRSIAKVVELGDDMMAAELIIPNIQQQLQLQAWMQSADHHSTIDKARCALIENTANSLQNLPTAQCFEVLLAELDVLERTKEAIQLQIFKKLLHTRITCLDLRGFTLLNDQQLEQLLKSRGADLRALDISGCESLTSIVFEYIERYAPKLLSFQANNLPQLTEIQTSTLKKSRKFKELRSLSLVGCSRLSTIKIIAPRLYCIRLSGCSRIKALEVFTNSDFLDLRYADQMSDQQWTELLKRLPHINNLALTGCRKLTGSSLKEDVRHANLLENVAHQAVDKIFLVENTQVSSSFLLKFSNILQGNTSVKELYINHCAIMADGFDTLLRNLPSQINLLDLSCCYLDRLAIAVLANVLRINVGVCCLNLSQCHLTPDNLKHLVHALANNINITRINLTGNIINDETLTILEGVLATNYSITQIDWNIEGCSGELMNSINTLLENNKQRKKTANELNTGIRLLYGLGVAEDLEAARRCFDETQLSEDKLLANNAQYHLSTLKQKVQKQVEWEQLYLIHKQITILKKVQEGQFVDPESKQLVFYLIAECYNATQIGLYTLRENDPVHLARIATTIKADIKLANLDSAVIQSHFNRITDIPAHQYYALYIDRYQYILKLIKSLLANPLLLESERDDLYLTRKNITNEYANTHRQRLIYESNGRNLSDRSYFLKQYILDMNRLIDEESQFLDNKHRHIDLKMFDLKYVDLSGLELRRVVFETSQDIIADAKNMTGVCLENTRITFQQLLYVRGFSRIRGLDPKTISELEKSLVEILLKRIEENLKEIACCEVSLNEVSHLSCLICQGEIPDLSDLSDDILASVIFFALMSVYINPLSHSHPISYTQLSKRNNFYEQTREFQETALKAMLEARDFILPAEIVTYVQLQKASLINARGTVSEGDSIIEDRLNELSKTSKVLIQDRLTFLKEKRKELKSKGNSLQNRLEQNYINTTLVNLYANPDRHMPLTPLQRLENVLEALRGKLILLDFTGIDLTCIDSSEFKQLNFTDVLILFTYEQEKMLTQNQKTQRCHRFFQTIKEADLEKIKVLLDTGIDINMFDEAGRNALMTACFIQYDGNVKTIIQHLIKKGADLHAETESGWKLIESVCRIKSPPVAVVRTLMGSGATIDFFSAIYLGQIDILNSLIKDMDDSSIGELVNQTDKQNKYPLQITVIANNQALSKWLVEHGADIEIEMTNGKTLLHLACEHGFTKLAKWLISQKINIDVEANGVSALRTTTEKEHFELANTLIQAGAKLDIYTAIALNHTTDIRNLIGERYNDRDQQGDKPLGIACLLGKLEVVQWLINQGVDLNQPAYRGDPALTISVDKNYVDIVKILIDAGGNVNTHIDGGPPLLWLAVKNGYFNMLKLLLTCFQSEKKFDVNVSYNNRTPLLVAVQKDFTDIAGLLIHHHANVTCCDLYGNTLWHIAASNASPTMMQILISAYMQVRNQKGEMPLDVASRKGDEATIKFLKNWTFTPPESNNNNSQVSEQPTTSALNMAGLFQYKETKSLNTGKSIVASETMDFGQ